MSSNLKQLILTLRLDVEKVILIPDELRKLVDLQTYRLSQPAQTAASELSSDDFLEQAERYFEIDGQNALLESLSNTQRAMRSQLDEWMSGLGFEGDLPGQKKLDVLKAIGFAPRILRRVSESGILLEQENITCTAREAEESLDLAQLFVLISRNAIIPLKLLVGKGEHLDRDGDYYRFKSGLQFEFKPGEKVFKVIAHNKLPDEMGNITPDSIIGEAVLQLADPLYLSALRLILAAGTGSQYKEQKALRSFWSSL